MDQLVEIVNRFCDKHHATTEMKINMCGRICWDLMAKVCGDDRSEMLSTFLRLVTRAMVKYYNVDDVEDKAKLGAMVLKSWGPLFDDLVEDYTEIGKALIGVLTDDPELEKNAFEACKKELKHDDKEDEDKEKIRELMDKLRKTHGEKPVEVGGIKIEIIDLRKHKGGKKSGKCKCEECIKQCKKSSCKCEED